VLDLHLLPPGSLVLSSERSGVVNITLKAHREAWLRMILQLHGGSDFYRPPRENALMRLWCGWVGRDPSTAVDLCAEAQRSILAQDDSGWE